VVFAPGIPDLMRDIEGVISGDFPGPEIPK
jgi:hypothetical protein